MFKFWGKYKQEKRKIFIAVLGIILTVFAACNSEAGPQTALQGNTQTNSGSAALGNGWEDMAEITVVYPSMGPLPPGLSAVEDEINIITEEKLNVHVNLIMIESGSYDQQVGLMMSSGETVDLLMTMPSGASTYTNMQMQGQLSDITNLLEDYGTPVLELLGDLVLGTTINGKIYGVTGYRNLACSAYLVMRTDVLEDLGLLEKAQNMTSLSEYEAILEAVKTSERWSYLAPLVSTNPGECMAQESDYLGHNNFKDMSCYDPLGDRNRLISINPEGSDSTVCINYETEEYKKMYEIMRVWYEKGYVYKDSATTTDMGQTLVKADAAFSFFSNSELGIEAAKSAACGMEMICVKIIDQPITTGSCTKFVWAVPSAAKEPEASIAFLSLMFTNEQICNLMAWGIEGVDYEVVNGIAKYIDGNETPAYHTNDFICGNQFLILPWDGMDKDIRKQSLEAMKNSKVSKYLGFSCDTSSVSTEMAAVINAIDQYRPQIETGMANENVYQEFLKKLRDSGVDKIIRCYQEQLDEWLDK